MKLPLLIISALSLSACGGGGGGGGESESSGTITTSESTDPNTLFSVPLIFDSVDRKEIELSGLSMQNEVLTGTKSSIWNTEGYFNGGTYNYLSGFLTLKVADKSSTVLSHSYYDDENRRFIGSFRRYPTERTCLSIEGNPLPSSIKLNDSNTWYIASCSDNTVVKSTWTTQATNSRESIFLVIVNELYDSVSSVTQG